MDIELEFEPTVYLKLKHIFSLLVLGRAYSSVLLVLILRSLSVRPHLHLNTMEVNGILSLVLKALLNDFYIKCCLTLR